MGQKLHFAMGTQNIPLRNDPLLSLNFLNLTT